MPFGDHIQSHIARVSREAFDALQPIPARRVQVPEVDPPDWWSEYLLEEWKRKNHLGRQPRPVSPGGAAEERWRRECAWEDTQRKWQSQNRDIEGLHPLWGNFAKGGKSE